MMPSQRGEILESGATGSETYCRYFLRSSGSVGDHGEGVYFAALSRRAKRLPTTGPPGSGGADGLASWTAVTSVLTGSGALEGLACLERRNQGVRPMAAPASRLTMTMIRRLFIWSLCARPTY